MIPLIISSIESQDDRDFLEDIYLSYSRLMYSEIIKIVRDSWAAEDLLQSVVEKLVAKVQLLRTLNKPKLINYVTTASRNTAYNYLRDRRKIVEVPLEDGTLVDIAITGWIDDRLLLQESIKNIHQAWLALNERYRRVLELRYFLDKTDEEISSELGILKGSVRMVLTRARNALRSEMEKLGNVNGFQ